MEAITNILNMVASKTAEQHVLTPGDEVSFYLCVDENVDHVGENPLQTVNSKNSETPSIRRTITRESFSPNDDTYMVLFFFQFKDDIHLIVTVSKEVPDIELESATLKESTNLYLS